MQMADWLGCDFECNGRMLCISRVFSILYFFLGIFMWGIYK